MNTDEPLFPVTDITSGPLPSMDLVLIRFDFLTNALQSVTAPNPGRNYVLTAPQARYLAERIQSALATLETNASQGGEHPTH